MIQSSSFDRWFFINIANALSIRLSRSLSHLKAASHISPCLILMKSFTQSLNPNMSMDFFPFLFVFSVHFRTYPTNLYMLDWSSYTQIGTALIQCSKYSSHSASRSGILYFRQMFLTETTFCAVISEFYKYPSLRTDRNPPVSISEMSITAFTLLSCILPNNIALNTSLMMAKRNRFVLNSIRFWPTINVTSSKVWLFIDLTILPRCRLLIRDEKSIMTRYKCK